ncbi:UNVERIFIED_CONTAM: histone H3-lysine(4) N-trimethyltransferase ATX1 [Sesamum indicum]
MTGGGRCQRRRKSMAGGRGTAEAKQFDSNCNSPNLNPEITEKPSGSRNITKLPPASTVEFDLYTQARKVLSFRSPFDSEDAQAPQAFVSGANTLPSGVSQLLTRHSDSRKRHKKLHSGSENKSSTPGRPRGSNFWVETEEYFRELTVEDIERLDRISRVGYSSNEKWFSIPSLDNENNDRYGTFNRMLASACEKDILNFENGVELNSNGKLKFNESMVQDDNGPRSMDIDGNVVETEDCSIKEESNGEKIQTTEKESTSFSGVEWLLGSRSKVYLASERPSKKRKLLGRDAGLEKLLVARAVEGSDSVCHYCSFGDSGDPLNCLIKCAACGMVVHQRCYGVQEDVDSSWLCSWCKCNNVVDLSTETPCLLCPRQGGALKPVRKRGYGSENDGSKMEFAHLFCCQWMPEVYLENTRTMEPIMNMDELKDTRRKLICYLCKVKSGACLRCSNGSCRTSFHPICAREARHRMEIWGKLGSDEVAVHLDCYRSVKSTTGPWHCEVCEDLFTSRGSGALATNSWEKPYFVAECGLCGGTAGAFRKSIDGQWIHALCAEWVLESTYRRGQVNPIEGMDTVCRGVDTCTVCRRKHGVCLKCSYGHCQTTFHPTCARCAGFYMTVRTNGGKLHHKAYCEKHSTEQKAKAATHRHGIEEFKSLKQVRVELERLRLLCERIIKREKLKRELVLCSHDILASSRDSVLSALARHPFYQPEVSSESATTSIKGYTDGYKSGSDMVQRSDDITVDSAVAGKRRVKLPMSVENDQRTDDSSTSQNLYTLKPMERVSFSGKQIPQRLSAASRNLSDDLEKRTKYRKHTETFEKELIMTSDQASMKNQRLPKGFVYVPGRCLSKDKETVPDACSREPMERNG